MTQRPTHRSGSVQPWGGTCSGGRTGCPLFDACLFAGMRRVYAHSVPFSVLLPSFGLFWFFVEQHKACCRS